MTEVNGFRDEDCDGDDGDVTDEGEDLDFDMWEGQFEFVGNGPPRDFTGAVREVPKSNGYKRCAENGTDERTFQILQHQVGVLQDSANQNDERYTRAKADNATLQARVLMLEEQLRETEIRYEEKLQDEQKRMKELISRLEREKQLQLENASIRLHSSETECGSLKEEISRQRMQLEKYETQRQGLLDQVQDLSNELNSMKDEEKILKEKEHRMKMEHEEQVHFIEELSREVERLRIEARTPALPTTSPELLRLEELHGEMSELRSENAHLKEVNEELQASLLHAGLETGRILTIGENSLAAELDIMSQDEAQQALKEQQEVNRQLRTYIEGILLNIVENHPQLLEVKHGST